MDYESLNQVKEDCLFFNEAMPLNLLLLLNAHEDDNPVSPSWYQSLHGFFNRFFSR